MKCDRCGLESEAEEAFIVQTQKPGSERKHYCPACWEKKSRSAGLESNVWSFLLVAVAVVVVSGNSLGGVLANILLTTMMCYPLSMLHELAHAATGFLMGIRVFAISMGGGKTVFSWRMFGIPWELHLWPIGGATTMTGPPQRLHRLRMFVSILAGPLLHAVFLAAGILAGIFVIRLHPVYGTNAAGWLNGILIFASCNLMYLVLNVLPIRNRSSSGQYQTTDGWKLLHMVFAKPETPETAERVYYILEYRDALLRNDSDASLRWAEEALRKFPGDPTFRDMLGNSLGRKKRYRDAREIFLSLLSSDEAKKPLFKYIISNNLAYADLCAQDPDLLAEAEKYSGDAYRQIRWLPEIVGTRGAVLVELGKLEEGIALLREAIGKQKDVRSCAINACHLAVAEYRAGRPAESRRYVERARKFDPECFLLEQTAREVGVG
jgi:hypothetical protein